MSIKPFRSTFRYNLDDLPSLGHYGTFLEAHRLLYDGARSMHRAVVASTTDAAANRHGGLQCRFRYQMDETTPATKTMPPFRPTCRYNLDDLPSLGHYGTFLEAHRLLNDGARSMHEAVVASTTDAAANRHGGRQCRFRYQMDETTPATKTMPPFRPTCRYNFEDLPSLGHYGTFLEAHRLLYDGARSMHDAVVASKTDVAANRHGGRQCRFRYQMDETTPSTKTMPPFRPACRYNLDNLPSLGHYGTFLEAHRLYDGARSMHEAVVASTTDAAANRHGGLQCRFRYQMDETTPATKTMPPFRPTCRYNLDDLPSLGHYGTFLEAHRLYDGSRSMHEAVVASTTDAAANRHGGLQCRFRYQMDETTPATKTMPPFRPTCRYNLDDLPSLGPLWNVPGSAPVVMDETTPATKTMPPFRPTCRYNLDDLPSLGHYGTFLEAHRLYDGARSMHEAVVASTTDAAANRHGGLQCRFCYQMDETTPATKTMPPFRPACRYKLDDLPSLGHYGTCLEEHRWFHDGARKVHEAVVASTTDAAANRHGGLQCRFRYQMDETTPATKTMPPFRPACRYKLDDLPSLGHYGTCLEEHRWFHDGARKVHEAVVASTTDAAANRHGGLQCRFRYQMDETTPATKTMPPFRPTCRYKLDDLPSLGHYGTCLEEHRWFHDGARKVHEAVVASTTDAAANRHGGLQCRFRYQMDETTPATKTMPPFRPACRYKLDDLPSLGHYGTCLEEHRWFHDGARKVHEAVVASTTDAAANRHGGLQCRFRYQMDETTPATKTMPPFRPTCRYKLDDLPSLGHYGTCLEEHRWFHDGARKVHEAVVASTTDAAANRHRGRQCRFRHQMDESTAATKSMPLFRPTCRYNLDDLPSLGHYGTCLEERRWFHDGARKVHEAVVASTTDAAANRHRGRQCRFRHQMDETTPSTKSMPPFRPTCRYNHCCLPSPGDDGMFLEEHRRLYDGAREHDFTSWLGPLWVSCAVFELAFRNTISGRKKAVVRCRRVATSNTRRVCGGFAVNSEPPEAYAQHLSEKTMSTPGLQEVVPGYATRIRGNLKRRSAATSTDDSGVENESPKIRLEVWNGWSDGRLRAERRVISARSRGPQKGNRYWKAHASKTVKKQAPADKGALGLTPLCGRKIEFVSPALNYTPPLSALEVPSTNAMAY
ncbi:hypothetical protein MTO96_013272 [Rhipicephalus appendiculatus]